LRSLAGLMECEIRRCPNADGRRVYAAVTE